MCPRQLIRNDAPLERDADALVGILLEGGSMPWPKAIRSLVDGAGDGLDHLGELRAERPLKKFHCGTFSDQLPGPYGTAVLYCDRTRPVLYRRLPVLGTAVLYS